MDFVKRNDIITVRNVIDDDPLPEMIECSISDATSNKTILQVLTINRISDIDLNQQIGSLRVISCNDLSCYVGIQYNYIVSNIGRVDANVTSVDRILNKYDRLDLLDQRKVESLVANQKFSLQAKETVNTCSPKSYSTKLIVKANEEESSSSAYCIASDTFSFEIIPDCDIKLNLRCKLSNSKNDNDCKNINTEKQLKCICSRNCTDSLLFQYTASQCEVRNNSSALYCMDSNGGPIPIAQLIVEDSDGSIMYKGMVSSEMIVEVRAASTVKPNKSCLGGSDLRVSVRHPSTGKILQQVLFHPTCSSADIDNDKNIRLLEAFGALNLIGYNCKNGVDTQIEEHKCLVNVEYDMEVQNTGISSLKVVDLSVSIDGDEASILKRTNRSSVLLDPTTSKTFTLPSVINRCSTIISATASSEVVGQTVGSQVLCQSDDNLYFQMTRMPTFNPTAHPSGKPSTNPTSSPSKNPTYEPSDTPTTSPSTSPSLFPSAQPSHMPNVSPSTSPSHFPSAQPSLLPNVSPSTSPSSSPTSLPSEDFFGFCSLNVTSITCRTVTNGSDTGKPCQSLKGNQLCVERPNVVSMLYNGGDCSQSDNLQPQAFLCEDFNGGPPMTKGVESYVIVADVLDQNITYFRGFVNVGEMYRLYNKGLAFGSDQNISIYSSDNPTFENLLQTVVYHTSCAINLELNNIFGASQIVAFTNSIQGNISVFVPVVFGVTIELGKDGDAANLSALLLRTSFSDEFVLSETVRSKSLQPGGTISVNEPQVILDLSRRRTFTLTATVDGKSIPSGTNCSGVGKESFNAGRLPSARVPTSTPTVGPSQSPGPTPDPLDTTCDVAASISCSTNRGSEKVDCSQLQPPITSKCVGIEPVLALEFIYNGLPCNSSNTTGREFLCVTNNGGTRVNPPLPSFITVQDDSRLMTYFNEIVALGDSFMVTPRQGSRFKGTIRIIVSTVSGNVPGVVLQELKLRVTCDSGDDISLLTQYGSLQLTGFTSLTEGRQSAFENIMLSFTISNEGPLSTIIKDAIIDSELFGTRDIIADPGVEFRRRQRESFEFNGMLNLYDAAGQKFTNALTFKGTAAQNNVTCSDRAELTVAIAA